MKAHKKKMKIFAEKRNYHNVTICENKKIIIQNFEPESKPSLDQSELFKGFATFMESQFSSVCRSQNIQYLKSKFSCQPLAFACDFQELLVSFLNMEKYSKFVRNVLQLKQRK